MSTPIRYFNRYTQSLEEEKVYGDAYLRFLYQSPFGALPKYLLCRSHLMSKFYGFLMNRSSSKKKILPFIEKFNVNTEEFQNEPKEFRTFNEFFYRKLKREARPIQKEKEIVVFPADGRHLGFQNISLSDKIFAKGQIFDLKQLLQSQEQAKYYEGGSLIISRLCPTDYHRFHYPVEGNALAPVLINGPLYSVNPIALKQNIKFLFENKRVKTLIKTELFGDVLMMELGATCVGSIIQNNKDNKDVKKGEEKGYFEFGGSCVILIFQANRIKLAQDLVEQTEKGCELYAHMGDKLGVLA